MEDNDLKNMNNIAKLSMKTLEYAEKKKEEIDKVKEDIDYKADQIGKAEYAIKLMSSEFENARDQTPSKVELAKMSKDLELIMKKAELIEETNKKRRIYEIAGFVILVIYSTINFFI